MGMLSVAYTFGDEADLAIEQAEAAVRLRPRDLLNSRALNIESIGYPPGRAAPLSG